MNLYDRIHSLEGKSITLVLEGALYSISGVLVIDWREEQFGKYPNCYELHQTGKVTYVWPFARILAVETRA